MTDRSLYAVQVKPGASFEASAPYRLFDRAATFPYEPSADGQRFLISEGAPDAEPASVIVVTNWMKHEAK